MNKWNIYALERLLNILMALMYTVAIIGCVQTPTKSKTHQVTYGKLIGAEIRNDIEVLTLGLDMNLNTSLKLKPIIAKNTNTFIVLHFDFCHAEGDVLAKPMEPDGLLVVVDENPWLEDSLGRRYQNGIMGKKTPQDCVLLYQVPANATGFIWHNGNSRLPIDHVTSEYENDDHASNDNGATTLLGHQVHNGYHRGIFDQNGAPVILEEHNGSLDIDGVVWAKGKFGQLSDPIIAEDKDGKFLLAAFKTTSENAIFIVPNTSEEPFLYKGMLDVDYRRRNKMVLPFHSSAQKITLFADTSKEIRCTVESAKLTEKGWQWSGAPRPGTSKETSGRVISANSLDINEIESIITDHTKCNLSQ